MPPRAVMEESGHFVLALHKALRTLVSDGAFFIWGGGLHLAVMMRLVRATQNHIMSFASCHSKEPVSRTSPLNMI